MFKWGGVYLALLKKLWCIYCVLFRVLVLNSGLIAEFDTPANLLEDRSSIFYGMAKDAGLTNGQSGNNSARHLPQDSTKQPFGRPKSASPKSVGSASPTSAERPKSSISQFDNGSDRKKTPDRPKSLSSLPLPDVAEKSSESESSPSGSKSKPPHEDGSMAASNTGKSAPPTGYKGGDHDKVSERQSGSDLDMTSSGQKTTSTSSAHTSS